MPRFWIRLALAAVAAAVVAAAAAGRARADAGVQVGARAGIELLDADAPFVGADVRLGFALSPLTVDLTFDHFFVPAGETMFQVGASALYDLPVPGSVVRPYAGVGMSVTRFAVPEQAGVVDSNGMRIGLELIGGLHVDHPALRIAHPFVQVRATVGPIDLFTIGGGVLVDVWGG